MFNSEYPPKGTIVWLLILIMKSKSVCMFNTSSGRLNCICFCSRCTVSWILNWQIMMLRLTWDFGDGVILLWVSFQMACVRVRLGIELVVTFWNYVYVIFFYWKPWTVVHCCHKLLFLHPALLQPKLGFKNLLTSKPWLTTALHSHDHLNMIKPPPFSLLPCL